MPEEPKKLIASALTLSMILLSSCSTKEPVTSEKEPVGEITSTEPTEPVFREYQPEDFKEINVNINIIEKEKPANTVIYDLSDIKIEPKMSKCKADDVRVSYYEGTYIGEGHYTEEEASKLLTNYYKNKDKGCGEPVRYAFNRYAINGDMLYLIMLYDEMCTYSHCFDVIGINIKTKELTTFYSHDSLDMGYEISDLEYANDALWLVLREHEGPFNEVTCEDGVYSCTFSAGRTAIDRAVYRLDLESGTLEKKYTSPESDTCFHHQHLSNEAGVLYVNDICETWGNDSHQIKVFAYNSSTDSFELSEEVDRQENFAVNGTEVIKCSKDENGGTYAECDRFRLNTGLRSLKIFGASDKRVMFWVGETMVYVYDLEKMERYCLEIPDENMGFQIMGENIVLNNSIFYYLLPEYGIMYKLCDTSDAVQTDERIITVDIKGPHEESVIGEVTVIEVKGDAK